MPECTQEVVDGLGRCLLIHLVSIGTCALDVDRSGVSPPAFSHLPELRRRYRLLAAKTSGRCRCRRLAAGTRLSRLFLAVIQPSAVAMFACFVGACLLPTVGKRLGDLRE